MEAIQEIYAGLHQIKPNLYLADLDQPQLTGFRQFIGCWIYKSEKLTFVVDPGPTSTIPRLVKALQTLEIKRLDYILLTHIHLDHAGGSGLLLQNFPQAHVNCHTKGIPHLIDPHKLWEGSLKVLGKTAEVFGKVVPVPAEKISYQTKIESAEGEIELTETPGHAAHHVCYNFKDLLFVGEVAGVNITTKNGYYQRIATPPRFIYEIYRDSLLKASGLKGEVICLGHYGIRGDKTMFFKSAKQQLDLWMEVIRKHFRLGSKYQEAAVLEELIIVDPALSLLSEMDEDKQQRERYFCLNSIRGMYAYFEKKEGKI